MKSTRILLIDDHAMFRQGIRMVLNKAMPEASILEAGAMSEAFTKARTVPSVILLDVQLPGLNGIEGLGMLKKKWPDTLSLCCHHTLKQTLSIRLWNVALLLLFQK